MIRKVAYMCAIMVAVQSRAELYGTSILELITSSNKIDDDLLSSDSRFEAAEDSTQDDWKYSVYDIGSKILQSFKCNVQITNFVNNDSSPNGNEVISSLSPPKFNVVIHDFETVTENNGAKDTDIDSAQFILPGNESIVNSGLLGISKSHFAKDIMHRGASGFAAFGYQN